MNYDPPSFRRPQEFNVPQTLDSLFNAYIQGRRSDRQDALQTAMILERFGGVDPRDGTPEQQRRGFAGPTMIPQQGPTQNGQPLPDSAVFDADPFTAALQRTVERKRRGEALGLRKDAAELANTEADTQKKLAEAGAIPAQRGTKAEGELRGELQALSKPFFQVRDAMGRIEASAKNPSAAGDLALIFNYMKVLDPGSTVREGEFATAQNSAGLPERVVAQYNKVLSGERMAPEQRQDFLSRARDLYRSQESIQRQQEEQYRGLSGRMGARPENVILNQGLPVPPPSAPPPGAQWKKPKDGSPAGYFVKTANGWERVP